MTNRENESAFLANYSVSRGWHDPGRHHFSPMHQLPIDHDQSSNSTAQAWAPPDGKPPHLLDAMDSDRPASTQHLSQEPIQSQTSSHQKPQGSDFTENDAERQSVGYLATQEREAQRSGPVVPPRAPQARMSRAPRQRLRPTPRSLTGPMSSKGDGSQSVQPSPSVAISVGTGDELSSGLEQPCNSPDPQEYPIRGSIQGAAVGLSQSHDPLVTDVNSAAANLEQVLDPLLREDSSPQQQQQASASSNRFGRSTTEYSNCRGFTGIGGRMVPGSTPAVVTPTATAPKTKTPPATLKPITPPQETATTGKTSDGSKPASPIKTEPDEVAFKTTFQFVINESNQAARNTVRKHVMKEYRRRERWEQDRRKASDTVSPTNGPSSAIQKKKRRKNTKQLTTPSSAEGSSLDSTGAASSSSGSGSNSPSNSQLQRKRLRLADEQDQYDGVRRLSELMPDFDDALEALEKTKNLPYTADPYAAIAASDVDPFSRLPMGMDRAAKSLLHHFAWVMPSLMDEIVAETVFNRLGWLYAAVAVHDPTPAHVIIGYSLGHIAGLRGLEEPAAAIEHKNKALRLVTIRMKDPTLALSDELIGAIVNIAAWELIDCNPERFAVHMEGLHRILTGRGGILALQHKRDLQTVLIRLDAIRAYVALSAPRFPTYACFRTLAPLAINTPYAVSGAPVTSESAFCEDALQLLHGIEDVLLLLKSVAATEGRAVSRARSLIEASVQQCLSPAAVSPGLFAQHRSRRCARLAALVFVDAAVQHFFDGDAPDSGCRRLKARLLGNGRDRSAMASWGRSLEMVIHVLLAADRLAMEKPWRAWYFADALTLIMKLGDAQWEAVEDLLHAYLRERCDESENLVGAKSETAWSVGENYDAFVAHWGRPVVRGEADLSMAGSG